MDGCLQKIEPKHHIRRSLSVPVNVRAATSQDAIDDSKGLIRVIVSTPRASTPNFRNGGPEEEISMYSISINLKQNNNNNKPLYI